MSQLKHVVAARLCYALHYQHAGTAVVLKLQPIFTSPTAAF